VFSDVFQRDSDAYVELLLNWSKHSGINTLCHSDDDDDDDELL